MATKILRLPAVLECTGLSRSTVYARAALGTFPKPISLGGGRAVGWLDSEVEEWITRQIELSRELRSAQLA
jgi:prophage regulatory protein